MKRSVLTLLFILIVVVVLGQSKKFDNYGRYNYSTGYVEESLYPLIVTNLGNGKYKIEYTKKNGIYSEEIKVSVTYLELKTFDNGVKNYVYTGDVCITLRMHGNKVSDSNYEATMWTITPISKFAKGIAGHPGYGLFDPENVLRFKYKNYSPNYEDLYPIK